jgi:N-acyl-L-homoserine lactone synthetase
VFAQIIDDTSARDARLVDRIYRLRYQVFRESLGWDVECLHGREIDEFDSDRAIYGAVSGLSGVLGGCFRLLPTTGRYMLKDVFPSLLHGSAPPHDPRVLECSRFAIGSVDPGENSLASRLEVVGELLRILLGHCLENDIHTVVCATDVRWEWMLRKAGLACERFGPPIQIGCTLAVAGCMHPTETNLGSVMAVLERTRMRGDRTSIVQAPRGSHPLQALV